MFTRIFLILFAFFLFIHYSCLAQKDLVHVNHATGTANISIPLFNLQLGHIAVPVQLMNNATGLKISDVEGNAGMNWNVVVGGAISRQVRGLPDDVKQDSTGNVRLGWLYNTNGTAISSFQAANDNNTATCADETTDINYIQTKFTNWSDTEPDVFTASAPGLNCQFVFDNNHTIRTMPYRDLKIVPAYNSTTGAITSFTVTNDQGLTYTFATQEQSSKQTAFNTNIIGCFFVPYYQFIGKVKYTSSWDLTSISDINNNVISFSYTSGEQLISNYVVNPMGGEAYITGVNGQKFYTIAVTTIPELISSVSYNNGSMNSTNIELTFNYNQPMPVSHSSCMSSISGFGRTISFNYVNVLPNNNYQNYAQASAGGYSSYVQKFARSFLTSVSEPDCSSPLTYTFAYTGVALGALTANGVTNQANLIDLPVGTDFWGYNGWNDFYGTDVPDYGFRDVRYTTTAGYDTYRNYIPNAMPTGYSSGLGGVDPGYVTSAVSTGTLSQITYGGGGYTALSYEPHDYYDNAAKVVVQGSGVRIKQIVESDGTNMANNIIKSYSYIDPTNNNLSSGSPISLPIYAFTSPFESNYSIDKTPLAEATVYSSYDLSEEDHSVLYSYVRETQTGKGSTLFQFSIPATYWNNIVTGTLPWSPTMVYIGRSNTSSGCPVLPVVSNGVNTYPFPPNPNYDFERGLPLKTVAYNDAGNPITETDYTYQTQNAPFIVTGFRFDYHGSYNTLPNAMSYAKYNIYTSTAPLVSQVIQKVYNPVSLSALPQQTIINYIYTAFGKITQQSVTNSDGTIKTTFTQYSKDYAISNTTPNDSYTSGLFGLQNLNINIPVETYTQVQPNGSSQALTTGGTLNKFSIFNTPGGLNQVAQQQQMAFSSPDGITTFQRSSVNNNGAFSNDPNYVAVENDLGYDIKGNLLSKDDGSMHITTSLTDLNTSQPIASISNARFDEVAVSDFDSNTQANFSLSSNAVNQWTAGRTGASQQISPGVTLSKTINKNTISKNYIASFWVNSLFNGQVNVSVTGGGVTNTNSGLYGVSSGTTPATIWQFCKVTVPISNITASTITVTISTTQSIFIDDVLFYPESADISTSAFDPTTFLMTAKTDINGVSAYYDYDVDGRILHVYDQDQNIVFRKKYDPNNYYGTLGVTSPGIQTNYASFTVNPSFNMEIPCTVPGGESYTWNFGDGGTLNTSSLGPITHTYPALTTNATYTVTVTATTGQFGSKSISFPIKILKNTGGGNQ